MSDIDLTTHKELRRLFPGLERVPSGVCSIQLTEADAPWIICPRCLLYMGEKASPQVLRGQTQTRLLEKCGFPRGTEIGIWAEVKVKYTKGKQEEGASTFDYTFDYVLMPLESVTQEQAVSASGIGWKQLERYLRDSGHTFSKRAGETYIEDFPTGSPIIVEVMTSSTSGGNKNSLRPRLNGKGRRYGCCRICLPIMFRQVLRSTYTSLLQTTLTR